MKCWELNKNKLIVRLIDVHDVDATLSNVCIRALTYSKKLKWIKKLNCAWKNNDFPDNLRAFVKFCEILKYRDMLHHMLCCIFPFCCYFSYMCTSLQFFCLFEKYLQIMLHEHVTLSELIEVHICSLVKFETLQTCYYWHVSYFYG